MSIAATASPQAGLYAGLARGMRVALKLLEFAEPAVRIRLVLPTCNPRHVDTLAMVEVVYREMMWGIATS